MSHSCEACHQRNLILKLHFGSWPDSPTMLVFLNILWRAEILGFDLKIGSSAKPNQILIQKLCSYREDGLFLHGFKNPVTLCMTNDSPQYMFTYLCIFT